MGKEIEPPRGAGKGVGSLTDGMLLNPCWRRRGHLGVYQRQRAWEEDVGAQVTDDSGQGMGERK